MCLLSTSRCQLIKKMSPAKHSARVAHHMPGRIRLKVHGGKRNEKLLHELRVLIRERPGVKDVSVNPATGSILIHYDSGQWQSPDAELRAAATDSGLFSLIAPD